MEWAWAEYGQDKVKQHKVEFRTRLIRELTDKIIGRRRKEGSSEDPTLEQKMEVIRRVLPSLDSLNVIDKDMQSARDAMTQTALTSTKEAVVEDTGSPLKDPSPESVSFEKALEKFGTWQNEYVKEFEDRELYSSRSKSYIFKRKDPIKASKPVYMYMHCPGAETRLTVVEAIMLFDRSVLTGVIQIDMASHLKGHSHVDLVVKLASHEYFEKLRTALERLISAKELKGLSKELPLLVSKDDQLFGEADVVGEDYHKSATSEYPTIIGDAIMEAEQSEEDFVKDIRTAMKYRGLDHCNPTKLLRRDS